MSPAFSVVTVTRNNLAGLVRTHASLVAQGFSDYEWLVVDGASDDGTVAWLEQLTDPRFRWSSGPDAGIYDAMNAGLASAAGDLVVFMNAGDRFARPDVLEIVGADRREHGWRWAYGAARFVADGEVIALQFQAPFSAANIRLGLQVVPHQAAYLDRLLLMEIGPYSQTLGLAADQDLMLRASMRSAPRLIGEVLAECEPGGVSYGGRPDRFVWEARELRRQRGWLVRNSVVIDAVVTAMVATDRRLRNAAARLARGAPD